MAGGTWERCVREVTLSADPETVGSVGLGWGNLSSGLTQLRDALVGRSFVGPIATGQERPHVGGLPGMLAGWKGSGGDAYREHLGEIGKQIEDLITDSTNVSGAMARIETDIRTAVASIPVPLGDDFGINEWSLPNGTELDDARDGESASGFLAALRKDYQSNPGSYADGAFRDKADDLEATMKVDGQAGDQKRGGWWDTKSHLDNWYRDNQQAANTAMSPLPQAVYTERPKLQVGEAGRYRDDYRPDDRVPPKDVGDVGGGGGFDTGGGPQIGSKPPGIGADISGGPTSKGGPFSPPPTSGFGDGSGTGGGSGSFTPPPTGSGYPGVDDGYSTGLAGAAPSGIGAGYGGAGGGLSGANLGSAGLGGAGGGFGGGAGGGIGGGGGGGLGAAGVGSIPGMVGGGNGKVPPMTSAANALRAATGAGAGAGAGGAGLAGGARGGAGMGAAGMGGMMGGAGGAGHGGGGTGSEHSSWLTEDDDPWGPGDGASPGILR
ncbi:hypothetical protein [Micromonospora parathelypteridis]|uniref:PPE family protein n=1 Tax=Micromonospora parathelypteridis TaxID=1839617 RepID=A0A840VJD6_9ACTN|nr:hypothetical protein [Micromonospora parathelypteridis]MBB5477033.1 hypothetical protein [Micromonospora parathelypteridis]GGO18192.1 hypothetical protein GCM10011576_32940 [Micromonospora parathelypteridis]